MKNTSKTKEELLKELKKLRQQIEKLEKAKNKWEQVREELQKAQERFSGLYNSSKDAMGFARFDGTLLEINNAFCELTGYSKKELLAVKKYQEITPKEYHEYEAKIIGRIVKTGKPEEYEKEYIRKDGSRVPILLTTFIVKGADGKPIGMAAILKDITERKKMETQIARSSRLSAMGEMIGGVAHELNNPLTSVLGNTQWLLTSKVDPKMLEETLQKIERSAQKCRDIVADLLEFTREKAYKFELADINDVVRRTLEMFQKQADISHIEIRTNYKKNLPLVNISASHIEQIFLNTMTNALHAMPEGGNLTVNTCLEEDTIQVKFQDTGVGIETEDLDKIFNPFYTKKVGSTVTGTGLGLSMAHKIIGKHKGTITAQSEGKGKGATFTVTLPVDKEGKSRK